METNNNLAKISLIEIVRISLLAAITCIATMLIRIPSLTGYTHIGDSMVFIGVILLGKRDGIISGALGMFLADLLGGYFVWAPITLLIKGIMALIVGSIAFRKDYNGKNVINNTFGFILGGTWMVTAYLLFGALVARLMVAGANTLAKGMLVSIKDVPGNVMQAIIGIAIAIPVTMILNRTSIAKH